MLEAKKYDIIKWIISLADEKVIDTLYSIRQRTEAPTGDDDAQVYDFPTSTYAELKDKTVDIEQLKIQRGYRPTSEEELSVIAKEANIEESIEELLRDKEAG